MEINVGDKVNIENELRTVSAIVQNVNNEPVIMWQSNRNSEGACIPSLWQDWVQGKTSRRG